MSTDLRTRLNSYHICFPDGYYIYALLLIKAKEGKKENFRNVLTIERTYHKMIRDDDKKAHLVTAGGSIEWYAVQLEKMRELLEKLADQYKEQVVAIYTSFKEGARHSATRHIHAKDYVIDGLSDKEIETMVRVIDEKYNKEEEEKKSATERGLRRTQRVRKAPSGRIYQDLLNSLLQRV